MKPTLENLIRLIKAQLGIRNIQPQDLFVEDLGAESVDLLNIVAVTEDTFGIELDEAELANIFTIQDLYHLIRSGSE